ncbi:MAG: hypothetical protein M1358_23170 [Chloroflexi bacterium]|nr:hypothetical protein [Chloroflexota bacterium]
MTLIITAVTRDGIVQVSDRRLTKDGQVYDDSSNRAICVSCSDGRLAISYTGLAEIGGQRTDEWLADYLASIVDDRIDTLSVFEALQKRTTSAFSRLRIHQEHQELTLVLAGPRMHLAVFGYVSNVLDWTGKRLPDVQESFSLGVHWPMISARCRKATVQIDGRKDAVDETLQNRINKLKRKMYFQDSHMVAQALVTIVRAAGQHPQFGKYIGRDCMSVILARTGGFQTMYHPDQGDVVNYPPHLIPAPAKRGEPDSPLDLAHPHRSIC